MTALRALTTLCMPTGAARAGPRERPWALLSRWHRGPADIADVACGIGTQLIGLAGLGHRVLGADISARAVRRARRECAAADVPAALLVADMRKLPLGDSCTDAVICADNALPHLLAGDDVLAALEQMRRILRPGGTAVITTRDYDSVLADPPSSTLPQVFRSGGERVISFQLWSWREGTDIYDLEHFQVHEGADGTRSTERRTAAYRAWTRAALTELASAAGLRDVTWHMPHETSFFQPVTTPSRLPTALPAPISTFRGFSASHGRMRTSSIRCPHNGVAAKAHGPGASGCARRERTTGSVRIGRQWIVVREPSRMFVYGAGHSGAHCLGPGSRQSGCSPQG
jgi:glycine/sarcosine N-methyltransferase